MGPRLRSYTRLAQARLNYLQTILYNMLLELSIPSNLHVTYLFTYLIFLMYRAITRIQYTVATPATPRIQCMTIIKSLLTYYKIYDGDYTVTKQEVSIPKPTYKR